MPVFALEAEEVPKESNRIRLEDRSFHDWYRFVLSFPPHLVQDYLTKFGADEKSTVLDPFCGTGTTIVECKKRGISSVGVEANPFAAFACRIKTTWGIDSEKLLKHAKVIAANTEKELAGVGISKHGAMAKKALESLKSLPEESVKILLKNSMSPIPMHRAVTLYENICESPTNVFTELEKLAFANALTNGISNLRFGPEIGLGKIKVDAPVVEIWLAEVSRMAKDLQASRSTKAGISTVVQGDARDLNKALRPKSIDFVITSPPYPNEKDYTRITRLESVFLGFMKNREGLKKLKQEMLRSNTRNIYKADTDDAVGSRYALVEKVAREIEARRLELGKTSGFEKLYAKVTRAYFGGMARHLESLKPFLKNGARLAYVVGDQASYFRIMIRTGHLLGKIAESMGYELEGIDLFRTRISTATKEQLREEVVVLRWQGRK